MATTSNQSPTYNITTPLPLGQAMRELPGQYFKVLTRPSVKTFAEEKGKVPHIYSLVLIVLALIAVHRRSEGSAEQSVPAQRN